MIGIYNVYYDGELIGRVRAYSEKDAIEQAYMKTGSASAYTGRTRRLYSVIKV